MDIDKLIEISVLFDFYKELLTEKQREIVNLYYNEDYSLGEISENLSISRQGVYDTLKRSEKILSDYESKLKIVEKLTEKNTYIEKICDIILDVKEEMIKSEDCTSLIPKIKKIEDICRELLG